MNKREEYIKNRILTRVSEHDRNEIMDFLNKNFYDSQSKKYSVWIAKEMQNLTLSKDSKSKSTSLTEAFQFIIDWAEQKNIDIFKYDFKQAYEEQKTWHYELETNPEYVKKPAFDSSRVIKKFSNGFFVYLLTSKDLKYEGYAMGHCVGGGSYASKIQNGESIILSLRDERNEPHSTIEIKSQGGMTQIQGKGNKQPIKKYRDAILEFIEFAECFA